jgi:hypothetical protein
VKSDSPKHFTHDYTNEYKSLRGITFAKGTAAILSIMVSQSKQTNRRNIPSYGRDKDNILYQRYVGYYNYYFDATSLTMHREENKRKKRLGRSLLIDVITPTHLENYNELHTSVLVKLDCLHWKCKNN